MPEASREPIPERDISHPIATPVPVRSPTPEPPRAPVPPPPSRSSWLGSVLRWALTLIVAGVAWYYSPQWLPWLTAQLTHSQHAPAKPPARPVPVLTAPVLQEDVNVYLNGLGTITAYNTVTVKSRVDGELINVAFKEGQMVKQGDLLAEIDPRPFQMQRDQAQGKMIQDEAALKLAQVTLDRQMELMKQNATTPQVVDQQEALVNQARALMQIDKAIYENTLLQLEYCRITAPISGRIGLRLVDRGNIVRANDPNGLMIITQLEPIALVFTIPQDEIPRVQERIRVEESLIVEAYDRDFTKKLATGMLSAIDNQVDAMTGTLRLKAMFENKEHLLFPNQFVNARLLIETMKDALVVPTAALQRGPQQMYVYVVDPKTKKVSLREVLVGPAENNRTCILSGLAAGEIVVTDGLDKLQPGAEVSVREKETSKEGRPGKVPAEGAGKPESDSHRGTSSEPVKKSA